MRNCMFKIAKLAAFSRKNISKNARSLDTVDKIVHYGQNCTLWTKIGHCGQKLCTADKNWTLWTKIGHSEHNWTVRTKMETVDKNWRLWIKLDTGEKN